MFNYTIRDKMRNGLLHHAAASGNLDSVRLLIQKFPYINKEERNSFGQTPLEIAMQKGNVDVYKYLMSLVGHAKSTWRDGSCYNPANIIPKIPFQQNPYMQQVMAPNGQMVNLYQPPVAPQYGMPYGPQYGPQFGAPFGSPYGPPMGV